MRTLQVALNGDADHPAMPRTARDTAADAAACVAAGANLLHFHAFDDDGNETLDAGPVTEAIRAVRAACPGVPMSLTTFAELEPDPRRRYDRIAAWPELPDLIPANQGEAGIAELSELLAGRGVGIEACLLSPADAETFVRRGRFDSYRRVVLEALDPDPETALEDMTAMEDVLHRAGVTLEQVQHGYGTGSWPLLRRAAATGHGVRTGIEDVATGPDGERVSGNPALVAAAAAIMASP